MPPASVHHRRRARNPGLRCPDQEPSGDGYTIEFLVSIEAENNLEMSEVVSLAVT
jgi:hypothetical protein